MSFLGNGIPSPLTGIPGWTDEKAELNLVMLGESVPANSTVVVIGGQHGRDACAIAYGVKRKATPKVEIYVIERFGETNLNAIRHNVERAGFDDMIHVVNELPFDVSRRWYRPVSLMYVRYSNVYQVVLDVIQSWLKHLDYNGIICFSDYWKDTTSHDLHLPVKNAVDYWHDKSHWKRIGGNGSLVWFIAPSQEQEEKVPETPPDMPRLGEIIATNVDKGVTNYDALSLEQLKALGAKFGIKLGTYKSKTSVIERLKKEGIIHD